MREIKLRAWNTKEKNYLYFHPLNVNEDESTLGAQQTDVDESSYIDCWTSNDKERYILEQFTGLLDSKGREIYEGDIVYCQNTKRTHEVKYEECEGEEAALTIGFQFQTAYSDRLEVIGNIHESE